jgi:hypothetical protein
VTQLGDPHKHRVTARESFSNFPPRLGNAFEDFVVVEHPLIDFGEANSCPNLHNWRGFTSVGILKFHAREHHPLLLPFELCVLGQHTRSPGTTLSPASMATRWTILPSTLFLFPLLISIVFVSWTVHYTLPTPVLHQYVLDAPRKNGSSCLQI